MRVDLWLTGGEMMGMGYMPSDQLFEHSAMLLVLSINESITMDIEGQTVSGSLILLDSRVPHSFHQGEDWQFFVYIPRDNSLARLLESRLKGEQYLAFNRSEQIDRWSSSFLSREYTQADLEDLFHYLLKSFFRISVFPLDWNRDLQKILDHSSINRWESLSLLQIAGNLEMSVSVLKEEFYRITGISIGAYLLHLKMEQAFELIKRGVEQEEACRKSGISGFSAAKQYVQIHFDWDLSALFHEAPTLSLNFGDQKRLFGYTQF